MFGLEILDVVIGLMFVYLLLSLLATAINEYVTAVMNLRGKELARGLGRLLDDLDEKDAVEKAFDGVGRKVTTAADRLTEQFYNHALIRPLATRRGWFFGLFSRRQRLPSYIPARTFAQALLDVLGVRDHELSGVGGAPPADNAAAPGGAPPTTTAPADRASSGDKPGRAKAELEKVLAILKRESPLDVNEHLKDLSGLLGNAELPPQVKLRLIDALTGTQTQLQKLHDSVEVWFNNSMDRVSGAYKRNVQGLLFLIGLLIASCLNADTIDMWRRLSTNDELRDAMARRAAATVERLRPVFQPDTTESDTTGANAAPRDTAPTPAPVVDTAAGAVVDTTGDSVPNGGSGTTPPDTTGSDSAKGTPLDSAQANYRAARARLDSMELKLGWTKDEARRAGLWRVGADRPDWFPFDRWGFWIKTMGLLLTALAISLGAPFWFDLLNKVISIRAAGRAPDEKPKSPQGPAKRAAEETPK